MTPVCRVTHLHIIRTNLSGVGADLLRWVLDMETSESADEAQPSALMLCRSAHQNWLVKQDAFELGELSRSA
jgi:hypothetical protein